MAKDKNEPHRARSLRGLVVPIAGLVAAVVGVLLITDGSARDEDMSQVAAGFLVLLGVAGLLSRLPARAGFLSGTAVRPSAEGVLLKWLALLATTLLLAFWFHDIAWNHDHAVHCYKAFHFWHEMLGRGRLKGWSHFLAFGYPAGELTPFGPELWVASFRAATLGLLSWPHTYALAFAGVVVFSTVAVFRFADRFVGPVAMAKAGFARQSRNAGGLGNPSRVPISAMAKPGFAWQSRNAGGLGNPSRVPISAAAFVAAMVWVLDPGTWYQGGWFWFAWLGVWPVTLSLAFTLLALVNLADLLSPDPPTARRSLLKAAAFMLASLVTHQLPIVVYLITLPCLIAAEWLRNGRLARRQVLRFAAALGLGLGLAAFFLVPMFARNGYVHDYGLRGPSVADLAARLVDMRLFENVWSPIVVLAMLGAVQAIRGGTAQGLFFVLCASVFVLLSSDILVSVFHLERVMEGILKVECPRMLLVAKLFCFPLAAQAAVGFFGRTSTWRPANQPLRRLGVVVMLALLGAPLVGPAWHHFYKKQVHKLIEHRGVTSLVHDLEQWYEWSARERHASDEPYRIAYSLMEKHDHIVHISPVFDDTFMYKVGSSPAQHFRSFPMSDEPEVLEAAGVKYLVADHDYPAPAFVPEQRFGGLRVYRFARYQARHPFTILGAGEGELVKLEPERIHIRLRGTAPGTRLKLHVASFPRWQAELNGHAVPIDPAPVYGMEYPILMEVPAGDGDLVFRYVRRTADWLGLAATLISLFVFAVVATGRPKALLRLDWHRAWPVRTTKAARVSAWATGAVLLSAGVLLFLLKAPGRPPSQSVLDGLGPTDLSLAGAACEPDGKKRWRCGDHFLGMDVVGGLYGSHLCLSTTSSGPLVVATRRELGRYLLVSYDPARNQQGRISLHVDDQPAGDSPTRGDEYGLSSMQFDTRARAGQWATLRFQLSGAPLHCFSLRILR